MKDINFLPQSVGVHVKQTDILTKENFKFLSFHSLTYVYRDKNTVLKRFEIRILFFSFFHLPTYGRGVINYNNEFKIYYSNDVKIRQDIR